MTSASSLVRGMSHPEQDPTSAAKINLQNIRAAMDRIRGSIRTTDCRLSETFSSLTGNSVFLKLDNQQRTGAFKERGALNKLLTLTSSERARGVIAASGR